MHRFFSLHGGEIHKGTGYAGLLRGLLCCIMVLFLLVGCQQSEPSATPTIPRLSTPTPPPTPSPSPTPAPTAIPIANGATASPDWDPSYIDTIDLSAAIVIDFGGTIIDAKAVLPETAGWRIISQSAKSIEGTVISVDDYQTEWVLGFDLAQDKVVTMLNFTMTDVYTCQEQFPMIGDVCMNADGIHWVEHNAREWQLMHLARNAKIPDVLESGTMQEKPPRVTSPEYHMLTMYEPENGRIRSMDGSTHTWYTQEVKASTKQLTAPEAVEARVSWVEETSRGWAIVSHNFLENTNEIYLLQGLRRPVKATNDGELLFIQEESGLLYCYNIPLQKLVYVGGAVKHYQHIPFDGAMVASTTYEDQVVRFQYKGTTSQGDFSLIPLVAIKENGRVRRAFHHSYEHDVALFLVERNGVFEQTAVSMKRLP